MASAHQSSSATSSGIRVFISYSRKDAKFADQLAKGLQARGFEVLIDRSEIVKFEDWWKRIEDLIASAHAVVFLVTENWLASEVCGREVEFSRKLKKRMAPVVFENVNVRRLPAELSRLDLVFIGDDTSGFERGLDELAKGLGTDIEWLAKHREITAAAWSWARNGRRKEDLPSRVVATDRIEEMKTFLATRSSEFDDVANDYMYASVFSDYIKKSSLGIGVFTGLFIVLALLSAVAGYWFVAFLLGLIAIFGLTAGEHLPFFNMLDDAVWVTIGTCFAYSIAFGLLIAIGVIQTVTVPGFLWGMVAVCIVAVVLRTMYRRRFTPYQDPF